MRRHRRCTKMRMWDGNLPWWANGGKQNYTKKVVAITVPRPLASRASASVARCRKSCSWLPNSLSSCMLSAVMLQLLIKPAAGALWSYANVYVRSATISDAQVRNGSWRDWWNELVQIVMARRTNEIQTPLPTDIGGSDSLQWILPSKWNPDQISYITLGPMFFCVAALVVAGVFMFWKNQATRAAGQESGDPTSMKELRALEGRVRRARESTAAARQRANRLEHGNAKLDADVAQLEVKSARMERPAEEKSRRLHEARSTCRRKLEAAGRQNAAAESRNAELRIRILQAQRRGRAVRNGLHKPGGVDESKGLPRTAKGDEKKTNATVRVQGQNTISSPLQSLSVQQMTSAHADTVRDRGKGVSEEENKTGKMQAIMAAEEKEETRGGVLEEKKRRSADKEKEEPTEGINQTEKQYAKKEKTEKETKEKEQENTGAKGSHAVVVDKPQPRARGSLKADFRKLVAGKFREAETQSSAVGAMGLSLRALEPNIEEALDIEEVMSTGDFSSVLVVTHKFMPGNFVVKMLHEDEEKKTNKYCYYGEDNDSDDNFDNPEKYHVFGDDGDLKAKGRKLSFVEMKAIIQLGLHENIVRVHAMNDSLARMPVLMERAPVSLREIVQMDPRSLASVARVLHDAACGLSHMHSRGLAYNNMKVDHVLVTYTKDKRPVGKLCSFAHVTNLAQTVGAEVSGDSFAMGVMIHDALVKRHVSGNPFFGQTFQKVADKTLSTGRQREPLTVDRLDNKVPDAERVIAIIQNLVSDDSSKQPALDSVIGLLRHLRDHMAVSSKQPVSKEVDGDWTNLVSPSSVAGGVKC